MEIQDQNPPGMYLIHDNAPQFTPIDYPNYGINGVDISVATPNMNAFAERVVGTIRREVLDHFILLSERQVRNIVPEYIDYYNKYRPHQGLGGTPNRDGVEDFGPIVKMPILSGLHHHYYRSSA